MIHSRTVDYQADDARMLGFFAIDAERQGARAAVLVAPEAPGLDDFNRERCNRLAALGYATFALDFHGDGTVLCNAEQIGAHVKSFQADPIRIRARAQAALAALYAQPEVDRARVAVIGYCFGGTIALELARSGADVRAVVGFHCGLRTLRPQDARNVRAKVLICNGVNDPMVPLDERIAFEKEMEAGGVDWQLHLYGGTGHAYTRPEAGKLGRPGFAYRKESDERSWQATLNLLEALG